MNSLLLSHETPRSALSTWKGRATVQAQPGPACATCSALTAPLRSGASVPPEVFGCFTVLLGVASRPACPLLLLHVLLTQMLNPSSSLGQKGPRWVPAKQLILPVLSLETAQGSAHTLTALLTLGHSEDSPPCSISQAQSEGSSPSAGDAPSRRGLLGHRGTLQHPRVEIPAWSAMQCGPEGFRGFAPWIHSSSTGWKTSREGCVFIKTHLRDSTNNSPVSKVRSARAK